jgi:hypothetical protein
MIPVRSGFICTRLHFLQFCFTFYIFLGPAEEIHQPTGTLGHIPDISRHYHAVQLHCLGGKTNL